MIAKEKSMTPSWIDPDDAPELTEDVAARAQITIGGKVIREATGTLKKRGRPPMGHAPKQQVTLRLPGEVIAYFKAGGPGWQTRVGEVLARYTAKASRRSAAKH